MPARKFTSRKKATAQTEEDLTTTAPKEESETEDVTLADAIEEDKKVEEEKELEAPKEPEELEAPREPKDLPAGSQELEEREEDGEVGFKVNNAKEEKETMDDEDNKTSEDQNEVREAGEAVGASGYRDESLTGLQMDNPSGGGKKWLVFLVILVLLGAGGYFVWKQGLLPFGKSTSEEITPSSVVSNQITQSKPAPESSPQASPSAKLEELKFEVLNGTETAGEASALKGIFEVAGFKNLTAGNATTSDHTVTEVTYPANIDSSLKDKIQKILEGRYSKVEVKTSAASTTQVTIIIGKKKS